MRIPKLKPQAALSTIEHIIEDHNIDRETYPCVLVGIAGYYLDSMGKPGINDRGIYDDAMFWVTPSGFFTFNANVDPSGYKKGTGKGYEKGMATLKPGVWLYKPGNHNGAASAYPAFRQAAEVVVIRDGIDGDYEDKGMFGINIHRGSIISTSSLGCQTIPPEQWVSFKELGYSELKRHGQKEFPYIKVDELERREAA